VPPGPEITRAMTTIAPFPAAVGGLDLVRLASLVLGGGDDREARVLSVLLSGRSAAVERSPSCM
jgi:hypothetical protein